MENLLLRHRAKINKNTFEFVDKHTQIKTLQNDRRCSVLILLRGQCLKEELTSIRQWERKLSDFTHNIMLNYI